MVNFQLNIWSFFDQFSVEFNNLYQWSGGKTPLEALFLAKFKQVDITNLKYKNDFLVDDWIYWAKSISTSWSQKTHQF